MSKEFIIRKCDSCNAIVKVLEDCIKPNSFEASAEKHIPTYEVKGDKILVRVNHVMEEEHYIEWIAIVFDGVEKITYFKPGDEPVAHCKYVKGSKIYSYCNKHELWVKEVE